MPELRSFIVAVLTGIAAYLHPIANNVFALTWLLGGNFIIGLLCGILVNNERFSWRKAWDCFKEATIIFVVVASVYVIGKLNGNHEGAIQCVSMIIYAACYFYGVRILRNLRNMAKKESPAWHLLNFLYKFMSLEFTKHIPYLGEYINKYSHSEDDEKKEVEKVTDEQVKEARKRAKHDKK